MFDFSTTLRGCSTWVLVFGLSACVDTDFAPNLNHTFDFDFSCPIAVFAHEDCIAEEACVGTACCPQLWTAVEAECPIEFQIMAAACACNLDIEDSCLAFVLQQISDEEITPTCREARTDYYSCLGSPVCDQSCETEESLMEELCGQPSP